MHTEQIPLSTVIEQLKDNQKLLCEYLHAVFVKDPSLTTSYQRMMVGLYIEYHPDLLLPFLKQSTNYQLEEAYKQCENAKLYREMVFLQQRMGNSKEALQLIMNQLGDVEMVFILF